MAKDYSKNADKKTTKPLAVHQMDPNSNNYFPQMETSYALWGKGDSATNPPAKYWGMKGKGDRKKK